MSLDPINNHVQQAKDRLTGEYKDLPNFGYLIEIAATRTQKLEDVLQELLNKRSVQDSEGVQLDKIGEMVGAPTRPFGMSDDDYRGIVLAQIAANTSEGTQENIIQILQTLRLEGIQVFNTYPAGIDVHYKRNTGLLDFDQIKAMLTIATTEIEINIQEYSAQIKPFGFLNNPLAAGFGEGYL